MTAEIDLEEWKRQEQKRKSIHSEVERKRRKKIDDQIANLSTIFPFKGDKADVVEAAASYVSNLQSVLIKYLATHPDRKDICKYLPTQTNTILTLLPSYKPPKHIDLDILKPRFSQAIPVSPVDSENSYSSSSSYNSTAKGLDKYDVMHVATLLN